MQPENEKIGMVLGKGSKEAIELYYEELTEYEKAEVKNYSMVYTIGSRRIETIYNLTDKEGYYIAIVGE